MDFVGPGTLHYLCVLFVFLGKMGIVRCEKQTTPLLLLVAFPSGIVPTAILRGSWEKDRVSSNIPLIDERA
jgi:hypothetical protein